MSKFPFARRPTIFAPEASQYISNASIIAARAALGRAAPVRIEFDTSGNKTEPLAVWMGKRSHAEVECMQLRKERKGPFFHEYIVFRLINDKGCFRIDRRQLPDETSPLGCTEDAGVEPYETIEDIGTLEESIYSPSECLAHAEFKEHIRMELIIDICREISQHYHASTYTVQRFNCYFYAQTIFLFTVCKEYDWYQRYIWGAGSIALKEEDLIRAQMPLKNIEKSRKIDLKILDKNLCSHLILPSDSTYTISDISNSNRYNSAWKMLFRLVRSQRKNSQAQQLKEASIGELQELISDMIHAHSVRIENFRVLLGCSAREVEQDIKRTMNDIWRNNWLIFSAAKWKRQTPPYRGPTIMESMTMKDKDDGGMCGDGMWCTSACAGTREHNTPMCTPPQRCFSLMVAMNSVLKHTGY
ncbi:unnamed protein product [Rhizoctonia solani]|uniref:Uncharacterized protein n=1 Tax=Rhizoctonia solani TaxID=456999 RepID=A0A8H2XF22_9AGAM|nr:unnamed protein product [Rhizoctonia solani]